MLGSSLMFSFGKKPERRELSTFEALMEFFRDLPTKELRCRFGGVDFDVSPEGRTHLFGPRLSDRVPALSPTAHFLAAGANRHGGRAEPTVPFARLFFEKSAAVDLIVSPRNERLTEDFSGSYEVDALASHLADGFLGESLPRLLTKLWPRYHIEVRDEYLDVSPLNEAPEESARVIRDIVEVMNEPREQDSPLSADDLVGLDSFCFHCGHPVASSTLTCPKCNGDLGEG
ncbi:MAG: hypothetical protein DRJ42_05315 [Deltaproteobacteria bacterium]|nr:MAG: hypothetical protein DRJ42_05315 [Deltaproteobacteria bacterium]